MQQCNLLKFL